MYTSIDGKINRLEPFISRRACLFLFGSFLFGMIMILLLSTSSTPSSQISDGNFEDNFDSPNLIHDPLGNFEEQEKLTEEANSNGEENEVVDQDDQTLEDEEESLENNKVNSEDYSEVDELNQSKIDAISSSSADKDYDSVLNSEDVKKSIEELDNTSDEVLEKAEERDEEYFDEEAKENNEDTKSGQKGSKSTEDMGHDSTSTKKEGSGSSQILPGCRSRRSERPGEKNGLRAQYIHLPKAGGTSIQLAINEWSKQTRHVKLFRYDGNSVAHSSVKCPPGATGASFLVGHRGFGFCGYINAHPLFTFTAFRSAVSRMVSLFDFNLNKLHQSRANKIFGNIPLSALIIRYNLTRKIEPGEALLRYSGSQQARFLCGFECMGPKVENKSQIYNESEYYLYHILTLNSFINGKQGICLKELYRI